MTTTITDPTEYLQAYLEMLLQAHLTNPPPNPPYIYRSQADLLREHGQWFTRTEKHPWLRGGQMQFCFANAKRAVFAHKEFRYFEGYAISSIGLPMAHAWVVDQHDNAFDVTWPAAEHTALVGVHVSHKVLRAHWRCCGGASVLEDWYHDHPCYKFRYPRWEPELVAHLEVVRMEHCLPNVQAGKAVLLPDGSIIVPGSDD